MHAVSVAVASTKDAPYDLSDGTPLGADAYTPSLFLSEAEPHLAN